MATSDANYPLCLLNETVLDYSSCPSNPSTTVNCLPENVSNTFCSKCSFRDYDSVCFTNHTVGFENNQFCEINRIADGFQNSICSVTDEQILNAIQQARPHALAYQSHQFTFNASFTLERNRLHITSTFDICGSQGMIGVNNYYPGTIISTFEFTLNYPYYDLATREGGFGYPGKGFWLSSNSTQVRLSFATACNRTVPVEPLIYVMNYEGMIMVGIESQEIVHFKLVANQFKPLDDQLVTMTIQNFSASATRLSSFSRIILLLLVIVLATL
jgi:hypothetical protein